MWPFVKAIKQAVSVAAPKQQWPDCGPIDKSDPYWKSNNNLNCNGVNYHKREVEPGRWQWVENEDANRRQREGEDKRRELYWALQTRVLTEDEELEALGLGTWLNLEPMVSYSAEEKRRELQDAWFQQRRLQLLARTETAQKQPTST